MRGFYILAFSCISLLGFCGQREIDSLISVIHSKVDDSTKVMAYNNLLTRYNSKPDKALETLAEMIKFSEHIKKENIKALCFRKIGVAYGHLNHIDKALEYSFEAAKIFEKLNDLDGVANCYNNLGSYYNMKGDLTNDTAFFRRSIEYHQKAIKVREEIGDSTQLVNSFNNIGNTYKSLGDFRLALEYFNRAYPIYVKANQQSGIEMIVMNMSECYLKMGIKENNRDYLMRSQELIGSRLKYFSPENPNTNYVEALRNIGLINLYLGQKHKAIYFLEKSLEVARKIRNQQQVSLSALELSKAYEFNGEFKKSLDMLKTYNAVKDSLINEKNSTAIEQMQTLYQSSKKDMEINRLNDEKAVKDAELSQQRTIIISTIGAIIMIMFLVIVIYSRYALKKKANVELSKAYRNIELKNQQITDSINYSKRIQTAILPPLDFIQQHLNGFFVFYRPKDIVSGDFYWFTERNNCSYIIIGDCTGHGVPGALMSMIGNTLLHEIIDQKNITDPGEILTHLNRGVVNALRQTSSDQQSQDDGMDVSICCINNNNPNSLLYATANHSIFIKTDEGVVELSGDIFSIGGEYSNVEKSFESKTYQLKKGSYVIMSSDGYYDQFGGEKNSKYLISRFEDLIKTTDFSVKKPETIFMESHDKWKGSKRQTDDLLVLGFRV